MDDDMKEALRLLKEAVGWFEEIASGGVWELECEITAEQRLTAEREQMSAYALRQWMKFCGLLNEADKANRPRSFRSALMACTSYGVVRVNRDVFGDFPAVTYDVR